MPCMCACMHPCACTYTRLIMQKRELPLGFSAISIAFSIASSIASRCALSFDPRSSRGLCGQNPPLIRKHTFLSLCVCPWFQQSALGGAFPCSPEYSRALCGMPEVAAVVGHKSMSVAVALSRPDSSCKKRRCFHQPSA